MGAPDRRTVIRAVAVILVLGCGLLIAWSDAGLPLPAAVVIFALSICLLAVGGMGAISYRGSRSDGLGFWRSIGRGFRSAGRAALDLF